MKKEEAWKGKKKFFKDGNPEVYGGFNYITWSRMTVHEREMWTPFDEVEMAPIPKEVIDFQNKEKPEQKLLDEETADVTKDTGGELSEEDIKNKIKAQLDDLGVKYTHNMKLSTLEKRLDDAVDPE